jgi:hypothetical protein
VNVGMDTIIPFPFVCWQPYSDNRIRSSYSHIHHDVNLSFFPFFQFLYVLAFAIETWWIIEAKGEFARE